MLHQGPAAFYNRGKYRQNVRIKVPTSLKYNVVPFFVHYYRQYSGASKKNFEKIAHCYE